MKVSIEEKAKAYDSIIEKANKMHSENCEACQACIEELIPELKESEDERMLNQLHSWMKEFGGAEEYTEKVYQWIKGLLEKQGEQKQNFCHHEVDLSKLEQRILDAKEMAKYDLTGNTMLRERIPLLIKMVRQVKTEVARTSIECRPDRFDVDRAEWYEPFEDIQKALDYAEYQIRTKLREHE